MSNKFKASIVGASMAIAMIGSMMASTAFAAALTQSQIDAIISLLQSFGADATTVANVQASLTGGTPTGGTTGGTYTFSVDLKMGSTGTDVMNLQKVLNQSADTQVAASGVGSAGNESTYFGAMTKAAVIKFQNKYASEVLTPVGLTSGTGYVGQSTRAKLNAMSGGTTGGTTGDTTGGTTTTTTTGTGITVSAATQPTATLAPEGATRIPFTKFTLTAGNDGDVTVTGVTVERTGLAHDAVFSGIVLLDESGLQIGTEKTLNSEHKATIGDAFTVTKGTSRTLTIAGNMPSGSTALDNYAGEVPYLSVVGIVTSATVTGTLPITGAGHTINATLSIGSLTSPTRGSIDPGSSQSKEVGTTGYTFSSIKLSAGSAEKVKVKSIRWNQSGSAAVSDIANIKTYVSGTAYDTVVSSDGKYYTSTFGDGISVDKGGTIEMSIKGDVVSGSARTIDFDVYRRTDVYAVGETYGYGVTPDNGSSDPTDDTSAFSNVNPWYDASQVTVSNGSITVAAANGSVPAGNIAENLAGQDLGAYEVDVRGESVSVAQTVVHFLITSTAGQVADITNISVYDPNGNVVAGPVDGSGAAVYGTATFSDTITYPVGKAVYKIKGKLGTDFANNQTITASTTPSSDWTTVKGVSTGNTITPSPSSALTMSAMTMKAGALTVSVSSVPIAQNVIAGSSSFLFANYIFDASGSGEDVRLTSIPLAFDVQTAVATEVTNCQLYNSSGASVTSGSNIINPSAAASSTTFTFDGTGLSVPKGTSLTLGLKCNVASGISAGDKFAWGLDSGQQTDYTGASGLTSGQTISETLNDSIGQYMTGSTGGSMTIALDTNSPGYVVVNAGATGVTLAKLKLSATDEDISLKQIALQLTATASNTPVDLIGRKVTLWDGSTQVGEAVFPTGDNATSSAITSFTIPRDGSKILTIKGDVAGISASGPLTASGDLLKVDYDGNNVGLNGTYGTGVASGGTINGSATDSASSGVRVMKAYPTFTKYSLPSSLLQTKSGAIVYRFSVTANGGDVALYKTTFTVSSSSVSATTSNYSLYSLTNSGFTDADTTFSNTGLLNSGGCVNGKNSTDPNDLTIEVYMEKTATACNTATTTYVIGSGTTRYFELRADVASVESGSGTEYITVQLEGDAAYSVNASTLMETASGLDGDTHDDFIWSPISTTTTNTINDLDYTNGYSITGLPGTNMSAETLTSSN